MRCRATTRRAEQLLAKSKAQGRRLRAAQDAAAAAQQQVAEGAAATEAARATADSAAASKRTLAVELRTAQDAGLQVCSRCFA